MWTLLENPGHRAVRVTSFFHFRNDCSWWGLALPGQHVHLWEWSPFLPFISSPPCVPAAPLFFFFVLTSFQLVLNKIRVHQNQNSMQSSCSMKSNNFFLPQQQSHTFLSVIGSFPGVTSSSFPIWQVYHDTMSKVLKNSFSFTSPFWDILIWSQVLACTVSLTSPCRSAASSILSYLKSRLASQPQS